MDPKYLFLSFTIIFSAPIHAQSLNLDWVAEYPSSSPSGVDYDKIFTDDDQNVYLCTAAISDINPFLYGSAIMTQKYDSLGNLLWENKFDNMFPDYFRDYAFTPGNTITIAGVRGSLPGSDPNRAELVNYDIESGGELWRRFIFDTVAVASSLADIDLDDAGNIYVFGMVNQYPEEYDSNKMYVAKIHPDSGEVLWSHIFQNEFLASKGKVLSNKIRVWGGKFLDNDDFKQFIFDMDLNGNIISSSDLPHITYGPDIFSPYFFFDKQGFLTAFGYNVYKWDVSEDPVWVFDFSRNQTNMVGQAKKATTDEIGNVYATGYLHDTINMTYITQTVKLSQEGALVWATERNFDESASWEGGQAIAVSDQYVFVCSLPWHQENNSSWNDYQIVLYSNDDGSILYDTLVDANILDYPYYAHYDKGHFYLLGRSYVPSSTNPDDYKYKIFKFNVKEMVNAANSSERKYPVTIFPNPVRETITVSQNASMYYDQMQLFDTEGKHLFSTALENTDQNIRLPQLPSGLYLLKLKGKEAPDFCKKIMIEMK